MRLLFVNQTLGYAGNSSYTLDLALALRSRGHEVQVVTTGGSLQAVFADQGFETYLIRFNPFSYWKFFEFLREYDPDLIHVQNRVSAPLGQRISRKLRIPHLVTVHRVPESPSPRLVHHLLVGVIAVNELIREALVNNLQVPKTLVRVIPRGVNVESLAPERNWPAAGYGPAGSVAVGSGVVGSSEAAGAAGGPGGAGAAGPGAGGSSPGLIPVIGTLGRLSRAKGQHVFLKAARMVLDRGIEAMFGIVGEGEEERALRRLCRELRLEAHVTFSPHIPSRRELYRIFDIVVVPTLRGGVGSAALEAMAMGKPVIASAVGELLHIVQDRKTGLLVGENDVEALADRMAELILRPDLCAQLGEAARAHMVEHFALAPMVTATQSFYEELCAEVRDRSLSLAG